MQKRNSELVANLTPDFYRRDMPEEMLYGLNVRHFGAKGDNSADDGPAINRALSAARPGQTVWLSQTPGTIYRISETLYVPPFVTFIGGRGTTIRLHSNFSGPAVIAAAAWRDNVTANPGGISLQFIHIAGNAAAGNYNGIITLGQESSIYQCTIVDTFGTGFYGNGILITNKTQNGNRITPGVAFNRQVVRDCRVLRCKNMGIAIDGPTDGYIISNHVNECDNHLIGTTPDADDGTIGSGGWQIRGNHISEGGEDGIRLGSSGFGAIIADNNIENFGIKSTGTPCAGISAINMGVKGLVISGNSIWTDENGGVRTYYIIRITSGGDGNVQMNVSDNFGRGNLTNTIPILVDLAAGGTSINCQVSNNQMHRVINAPQYLTDFVREDNNSWDRGNAAPTVGTWRQGNIVWRNNVAASSHIGWVCVTAGSPGTWKTWGAISA